MIYKEFCEDVLYKPMYTDVYKVKFPRLFDYLLKKYQNYELLYPVDVFFNQIVSLFEEYSTILKDVEDAFNIRNKVSFNESNLGDTKKRHHKDDFNQSGSDNRNYQGYNVIGKYQEDKSLNETERTISATFNEYNLLNALRNLENNGKRVAWFKFEKLLVKLFITIYPIVL